MTLPQFLFNSPTDVEFPDISGFPDKQSPCFSGSFLCMCIYRIPLHLIDCETSIVTLFKFNFVIWKSCWSLNV